MAEGTPTPSATTRWTVTRLRDHLVGTIVGDRNASGGDVPDRLGDLVREAGQWLWNAHDWRHRYKQGTLTTVASTGTAALADDFGEMAQRWLNDPQAVAASQILFVEDPVRYQIFADNWDRTDSTNEHEPQMACILEDSSQDMFTWYAYLAPVPDAEYTYPYMYLTHDPWTEETITDDDYAPWPKTHDEGWYWQAKWRVENAFRGDDRWKESFRMAKHILLQMKKEADETMSRALDRARDVYGDFQATTSALGSIWTGFLRTRWP